MTMMVTVTVEEREESVVKLLKLMRDELGVSREKLEKLFGYSGLPRYEKLLDEAEGKLSGPVIEGEVETVP